MKVRVATFCVARYAMHRSLPGRDGSHGCRVPDVVECLDYRVAHHVDGEVAR
jgi:hypothetical protein